MQKIFHFHLKDGCKNKSTLVCNLVDGSIKYSFFTGTTSSGTPLALSNIQFYDKANNNIIWKRSHSLPVDTLHNETKFQFKCRVKDMLYNSTHRVFNEVKNKVTFA